MPSKEQREVPVQPPSPPTHPSISMGDYIDLDGADPLVIQAFFESMNEDQSQDESEVHRMVTMRRGECAGIYDDDDIKAQEDPLDPIDCLSTTGEVSETPDWCSDDSDEDVVISRSGVCYRLVMGDDCEEEEEISSPDSPLQYPTLSRSFNQPKSVSLKASSTRTTTEAPPPSSSPRPATKEDGTAPLSTSVSSTDATPPEPPGSKRATTPIFLGISRVYRSAEDLWNPTNDHKRKRARAHTPPPPTTSGKRRRARAKQPSTPPPP